jgi:hypothetical protein
MRHLLAKDLRLVAPYLWLIVPVHALYCLQSLLNPELYFWTNLSAAIAWTAVVTGIEWHVGADHFISSLPVSRESIVLARYVSALGGLALGAALFVLYGHVTFAIPAGRVTALWQGSPSWGTVDGVAAFLAIGCVVAMSFLPFFFRWGLPLGGTLFSAAAAVALAAGTAVARIAHDGRPPAARPMVISWSETVRSWLLALSASWGPWMAASIVVAGAAVLGAASLRLSIRFYRRRAL